MPDTWGGPGPYGTEVRVRLASSRRRPGVVAHVPKNTIVRESNPSDEEQEVFVVRVGHGVPVTNVDGPEE